MAPPPTTNKITARSPTITATEPLVSFPNCASFMFCTALEYAILDSIYRLEMHVQMLLLV